MARPSTQNRMAAIGYFGALAALAIWVAYRAFTAEKIPEEVAHAPDGAADSDSGVAPLTTDNDAGDASPPRLSVLVRRSKMPGALAVDERALYFADYDSQYVASVPLGGGVPVVLSTSQLLGGGVPRLRVLVASGDELFWTTDSAVFKTRKGESEMAAPLAVDQGSPMALAVDKDSVYWMSALGLDAGPGSQPAGPLAKAIGMMAIFRVPRGGGAVPRQVAPMKGFGCGLATDATHLYWAEVEPERLVAMPKAGGAQRVLTTACGCDFLLDDDRVFCTKSSGDQILAFPKSSNGAKNPEAIAATADGKDSVARAFAADATHLYWIGEQIVGQSKRGAIYRVPKAGGKRERLTVEEATREIEDLVVGDRWILWSLQPIPGPSDPDEPAIMRMAK